MPTLYSVRNLWYKSCMDSLPQVVIIELGSQYTLLIERTIRELGVRSVVLDHARAGEWLKKNEAKAVILSGGAASVYEKNAPQPPEEILSLKQSDGRPVPVLGICYGMQWLAHHLGGEVKAAPEHREYGKAEIRVLDHHSIFLATPVLPFYQDVWMSHGDSVEKVPDGFKISAHTHSGTIAAMERGTVYGVQFHPEVTQTQYGKNIFEHFLFGIADCVRDWQPSSIISGIQEHALEKLGEQKAIIGLSGGVDSTTLSKILSPALKEQLFAITIDGGHLREGELDEIRRHAECAGVSFAIIDARDEFSVAMADVTDAEEKRWRFKSVYGSLFVKAAQDFGAKAVIQGTLAPDRIESGATGGAVIKAHHNVGLNMGNLLELHPIAHLFKYEVRALARELGLPESVWNREPFPGPGLFIRVVGTPATPEKLNLVRWADAEVKRIVRKHGAYGALAQLVTAYVAVPTVGVKGDARVYGGAIVVRAVETTDFMTARGVHLPNSIKDKISTVLTRHPEIVRVWFDATHKPPATTEFE